MRPSGGGRSVNTTTRTDDVADRLAVEAARAARVRALSTDPNVIALRVERVRVQVDRLMWAGILLGLAFTMTNVQAFAAGSAPLWSTAWVAAWALDPMVSLVLLAVLRAEQVTARWQVRTGPWARRARWGTLAATYVMNTWSAWAEGIPSQVVLHSVPPLVVFVAAEAVTGLRESLTEAVHAAAHAATALSSGDRTGQDDAGHLSSAHAHDSTHAFVHTSETNPAPSVEPDDTSATGANARVMELAELLAAGAAVTGAQTAALFGCSERTGRRLLTRAADLDLARLATPAGETAAGTNVLRLRAGWS